jgi:uncharacterized protein YrzB (UPF0473 family)
MFGRGGDRNTGIHCGGFCYGVAGQGFIRMKSPCIENKCGRRDLSKDHPDCLNCKDRLEYISKIGGPAESLPIQFSDAGRGSIEMKGNRFSQEDTDFIEQNFKTMGYKEIADKIGRPIGSIQQKIYSMGLKKRNTSRDYKIDYKTENRAEIVKADDKKRDFFVLDFTGNEHLFEKLQELAKSEFRTMENQIFYMIATANIIEQDQNQIKKNGGIEDEKKHKKTDQKPFLDKIKGNSGQI